MTDNHANHIDKAIAKSLAKENASKDLNSRIKSSKSAMGMYPEWVRKTMLFQGGGVRRSRDD